MNYKIVNLRAVAILLVVIGHSMIVYTDWPLYLEVHDIPILNFIKCNIINPFQLSIFFFISGWLLGKSLLKVSDIHSLVKKKFSRLIIPYFSIAFLWLVPIKVFLGTPNFDSLSNILCSIIKISTFSGGSAGHLWFLPTLFFIIIFFLFSKNYLNTKFLICISCLLNIIAEFMPPILYLNSVCYYFIFFYEGYLLFNYKKYLYKIRHKSIILIFSFCGTILVNSFLQVIFIFISLLLIYYYIPNRNIPTLEYLSIYSFGIYLFHSPLIYITFTYFLHLNPILVIGINLLIFGGIAIILTRLMRKTRFKFIIGE